MKKTITISLSPNVQRQDISNALNMVTTPWKITHGDSIKLLEQWFRNYFSVSHAVSFNSGRSALCVLLKALGVGVGDEVILQAFTCVVVPAASVFLGATPVFVDIKKDLTMDPLDLEKKITKKTKAIIVQHTFGIPTDMKKIMEIARTYNIPVIEDVAHTIGGTLENRKLGTYGMAAFFSFGRDKAFSSVFGGIAITNNKQFGKKIRLYQKQLAFPPLLWTIQQVFHPIALSLVLPLYNIMGLGKVLLVVLQNLNLLSFPVSSNEKMGNLDKEFIKKMPNGLAVLALSQLLRIVVFNSHREKLVDLYTKSLKNIDFPEIKKKPLLRFPIFVDAPDQLVAKLKKDGIYLGRWYSEIIDPKGSSLEKAHYTKGSCKNAEKWAEKIVNLPTHPNLSVADAKKIIALIQKYVGN